MKVEDWCKKNNISKHKYYCWHHKIRKQENTEGIEFANITPNLLNDKEINNVPAPSCDFQILYKDIQITVPNKFNPDTLAELLKVLLALWYDI
jgi:hypothetical protein